MSEKTQNRPVGASKVEDRKLRMYGNTDLSNLEYLEKGDLIRVADTLKKDHGIESETQYISKVKNLICKNTVIMSELLKKGGERRKLLQQATA